MTSRKCINALSAAFCLYVRRKTYALPFFESFRVPACDKVSSKSSNSLTPVRLKVLHTKKRDLMAL